MSKLEWNGMFAIDKLLILRLMEGIAVLES